MSLDMKPHIVDGLYLKYKGDKLVYKKLSGKQSYVLNAIKNYINKYGYSPTVRELADMLNVKSTSIIN